MECKQCGGDEDRLKGFCSVECRNYYDYELEIDSLKKEISRLNAMLNKEPVIRILKNKVYKE